MIKVTEVESFWTEEDWLDIKDKYYMPLVTQGQIFDFQWEGKWVGDVATYEVTRSYWDYREREQPPAPGPKQVPPHIKMDCNISAWVENAADGLEIIQDYQSYWPGMNMVVYGLAQAADTEANIYIQLTNYEHDDEEEEYEQISEQ